jgi:hypothetical protein
MDKDTLARKAFQNTKLYFARETATFTVQLYNTEVVTIYDKEGTVVLNTGGFKTLETLEVINQALQPFSYRINEDRWNRRWEVQGNGVPPQQFEDGMKIHEIARWPITAKQCERRLQPLIDAAGPPRGARRENDRPRYGGRSRSRSRGRENGRSYGGRKEQRMQVDDDEEVTDFQ